MDEGKTSPQESISRHHEALASVSDREILEALGALEPLPDEGADAWDDQATWDRTYRFLALADISRARRLRPAIHLLLERASYGDPGETMHGLRHTLEGIVNPDWDSLADACLPLAMSERLGTQLWALSQLVVLEDERARPVFEAAARSPLQDIRQEAELGLARLDRLLNRAQH